MLSSVASALLPTANVQADTVTSKNTDVEVTSQLATLYDGSGNKLDVALPANSTWHVGSVTKIDGKDYYEVSTNAYLSSSDSFLYKNRPETIKLASGQDSIRVYDHNFVERSDMSIAPGTYWYSDTVITNGAGMPFLRISTDAYVSMYDVSEQKVTSSIN
jgi:hypothetical protein